MTNITTAAKESLDQSSQESDKTDKSNTSQRSETFHQNSVKNSNSGFLSRLQSSTSSSSSTLGSPNQHNNPTSTSSNLPSSFANALSSISSFTSNFSIGSSSNNPTTNRNGGRSGSSNNINNHASSLTIETLSTSASAISLTNETREQVLSKKASLERKNLINLTKLIVKDLISSSLIVNRTIDDCHSAIHLNNYFALIDRILKHGLKQNLLSNRSTSLWNALDNLPKYLSDERLTSETVRSLAHTKTPDGKVRAWLRIAMMQKKLPEYFNELLANKNILLKDIYHDYAFMMNDEAHVFAGLIIGVNVIDCNFFVKDDNFDMMDEVIDLAFYLRAANSFDDDPAQDGEEQTTASTDNRTENMATVLDQKNYLEERSKHLESLVASLRERVKSLEGVNSKLEIDAKVNEVRIQKLQDDGGASDKPAKSSFPLPDALKVLISPSIEPKGSSVVSKTQNQIPETNLKPSESDEDQSLALNQNDVPQRDAQLAEVDQSALEVQRKLVSELDRYQRQCTNQEKELTDLRERVSILETSYRGSLERIRVLERDLDIQTSMNKDNETTIKIYEKDLREKQGQVESLRESLADAKKLNSDLNERLNDTSTKLKDRLSSVTILQASLDKWKLENKSLANRLQNTQTTLKSVNSELQKASTTINDLKKYNEKINDDLKRERECGQSSSITVETQNSKITELTDRLKEFERELEELRPKQDKLEDLKRKCQEYEQSLEEVGYQLRESRLEVENLKENSSMYLDSQWMDSKQVKNCALCQQSFSVTRRKHHCRLCGNVFCQTCSDNKMELASSSRPVRVCDTCHAFLLAKFVRSSSSSASSATKSTV